MLNSPFSPQANNQNAQVEKDTNGNFILKLKIQVLPSKSKDVQIPLFSKEKDIKQQNEQFKNIILKIKNLSLNFVDSYEYFDSVRGVIDEERNKKLKLINSS